MTMDTCAHCRHWTLMHPEEEIGHCRLTLVAAGKVIVGETRAYVVTDSFSPTVLATRADYGCTQFEGRA